MLVLLRCRVSMGAHAADRQRSLVPLAMAVVTDRRRRATTLRSPGRAMHGAIGLGPLRARRSCAGQSRA